MADLTPEIANELVRYDAKTGKLFWRPRDRRWFKSDRDQKAWNTLYADKEALTALTVPGYRHGHILGKKHYAHRIIWLLETGDWPPNEIDHINGDRADNRVDNLRSASSRENRRNQRRSDRNTSGHTGVCWSKVSGKWRAQIMVDKKNRFLGHFDNIVHAVAARKQAEMKFGFHENHGRLK